MKLIFAVLDVSLTMGLTRFHKAEGFLHLLLLMAAQHRSHASSLPRARPPKNSRRGRILPRERGRGAWPVSVSLVNAGVTPLGRVGRVGYRGWQRLQTHTTK